MVIAEAVPSNIRSALQSPVVLVSNNTTTIFIHIFINDNFSPHLNIFQCLYYWIPSRIFSLIMTDLVHKIVYILILLIK